VVGPYNTAGASAPPPDDGTAEEGEGGGGGGHTQRMTEEGAGRHHVGVARAAGSAAVVGTPASISACGVCVVDTHSSQPSSAT